MSAADMFAPVGCEHVCSNFQNQPVKSKNATASIISSTLAVGAVILATQLRAEAQETENENSELEVSNLSLDAQAIYSAPAPDSFNVDNILGSAVTESFEQPTDIALLGTANSNSIGTSAETSLFPSENGLPKGVITQSPGVDNPTQTTGDINLSLQNAESANIEAITVASGNAAIFIGEDREMARDGIDGLSGADGQNGIDGANGLNGRDGVDGRNGIDGIDGTDGRNGLDGADGSNGIDGQDGTNGADGSDGQTVFVLDPETLQNPAVLVVLNNAGVSVTPGPEGFGFVAVDANQLEALLTLVGSINEEMVQDEPSVINGNITDNVLFGDDQDNIINGFDGDDILAGGLGADALFGGAGSDTANYFQSVEGVNINLATNINFGGQAEGDLLDSIENVFGSNLSDTISGDTQANSLFGNGGDDTLLSGTGNDRIQGGTGADIIDGGEGIDLADYSTSSEGVNISLLSNTAEEGDADGDTLISIENINGSRHFDTLEGDDNDNRLGGLSGSDELFGEGGDDTLLGGSGADLIEGGEGIDTSDYTASTTGVSVNLTTGESLFGEAEGDQLISIENLAGSLHDDILTGDDGINRLTGRDGDDALFGEGGNDRLIGGLGADHLDGGEGSRDTADYSAAEEAVGVDLQTGGFFGEADGDTFESIEFVVGSSREDMIFGDDALNRINGGDGADILSGRGGNDSLLGGEGDDVLIGGEGNDVFVFETNNGFDIIEDFEAGQGRTDRVDLRPLDDELFDEFEDVQASLTNTTDGAVLDLVEGSILFQNIVASELVADDFILA